MAEILGNPDHAARISMPDGPLVFVREADHVAVLEVPNLLLRPETDIRRAALHYLKNGASYRDPWLRPETAKALENRSTDIESGDIALWRAAGIELVPLLREDLFAQLAGLRQSRAAKYDDGLPGIPRQSDAAQNLRLWLLCPRHYGAQVSSRPR